MSKPIFSLLHATARMPHGWIDACRAWSECCDEHGQVEYLLVTESCDAIATQERLANLWPVSRVILNCGKKTAVTAWNAVAEFAKGNLFITVADDYFPPDHWDTEMLEFLHDLATDERAQFVLDVDNQDNSYPLLPFSFISRAYYERLGYLFWPEYHGIGADCDFTEVARRDGVVIDCRFLKFEHRHWSRGLRPFDEVDAHQQSKEAEIAHHSVLARRRAQGFPDLPR